MFIENFLADPAKMGELGQALSTLRKIGFFPVMLEVGQNRSLPPKDASSELNAMRATWRDGYDECLRDIHEFFSRYVPKPKAENVKRDFGALDRLLRDRSITQTEYNKLRAEHEANSE